MNLPEFLQCLIEDLASSHNSKLLRITTLVGDEIFLEAEYVIAHPTHFTFEIVGTSLPPRDGSIYTKFPIIEDGIPLIDSVNYRTGLGTTNLTLDRLTLLPGELYLLDKYAGEFIARHHRDKFLFRDVREHSIHSVKEFNTDYETSILKVFQQVTIKNVWYLTYSVPSPVFKTPNGVVTLGGKDDYLTAVRNHTYMRLCMYCVDFILYHAHFAYDHEDTIFHRDSTHGCVTIRRESRNERKGINSR